MIAVIVPAHDEEVSLGRCLAAIRLASRHPGLRGEAVMIIVVLDTCTDASAAIAGGLATTVLEVGLRNVGAARAVGADHAVACGARWLANTDADTVVATDWLWQQLALEADAVCGTVAVDDWSEHGLAATLLETHFLDTYTDADGHRHIHGANLGVCARAYQTAGGFPALACSEDVGLVQALQEIGALIAWSAAPRVVTSARRRARAAGGFGDTLCAVVRQALAAEQSL